MSEETDYQRGKDCLRVCKVTSQLKTRVAMSLADENDFDASAFAGTAMGVAGNNEDCNIRLIYTS